MLFLGTSGWNYKHWVNNFYPKGLPAREQLAYLSQHFNTVELNASFYRLPLASSFDKWNNDTPDDFTFSVKVPRPISHFKRLAGVEDEWRGLREAAKPLAHKIRVYLCQFPPSFRASDETVDHLEAFSRLVGGAWVAFEFRHATWFEPAVLARLKAMRVCVVQAESSRYPHTPAGFSPAPFAYYRFHGPRTLYSSSYNDDDLQYWAALIERDMMIGKDVFVYFDNDFHGYATQDAGRLGLLLGVGV